MDDMGREWMLQMEKVLMWTLRWGKWWVSCEWRKSSCFPWDGANECCKWRKYSYLPNFEQLDSSLCCCMWTDKLHVFKSNKLQRSMWSLHPQSRTDMVQVVTTSTELLTSCKWSLHRKSRTDIVQVAKSDNDLWQMTINAVRWSLVSVGRRVAVFALIARCADLYLSLHLQLSPVCLRHEW